MSCKVQMYAQVIAVYSTTLARRKWVSGCLLLGCLLADTPARHVGRSPVSMVTRVQGEGDAISLGRFLFIHRFSSLYLTATIHSTYRLQCFTFLLPESPTVLSAVDKAEQVNRTVSNLYLEQWVSALSDRGKAKPDSITKAPVNLLATYGVKLQNLCNSRTVFPDRA